MTCRGLVLRQLSRIEAAASRARAAPRATLIFDGTPFANGSSGSLRLSVDHGRSRNFGPDEKCLSLAWGVDQLELRCPASLPWQILSALDSTLEVDAMPSDLEALLLEAAMLPLITLLEQATRRDISIIALKTASPGAVSEGLGLVLERGDRRWHLLLSGALVSNGSPDPIAALFEFWPIAPAGMARFCLPAALRIGTTPLSVAAFKSLQLGDAVLLQIGDGKSAMLVVAEAWTAITQQDAAAVWRVLEAPKAASKVGRMEWTMRSIDTAESELENSPVNDPDQLPVRLTFEVGRLEITLAELRKLGPGSVVELGRNVAEPVHISAQGRPVGQGELVDVEGMVGVKIVRLFDYE
jgi:type III secretion protein Q